MSVTVVASVVLGCRLTDVAREEVRTAHVHRFNEVTGVPYTKTETATKVVLGAGVHAKEFAGWGELREFFETGKAPGVCYADSGGVRGRHDKAVLGVELARVGKYDETPAKVAHLATVPHLKDVRAWLLQHGMPEHHWREYLVLYVG